MGGTLALTCAALRPKRVQAFVAMATPVDFHEGGVLSAWTSAKHFNVDALVDAFGNVPTWLMEGGLRMLRPTFATEGREVRDDHTVAEHSQRFGCLHAEVPGDSIDAQNCTGQELTEVEDVELLSDEADDRAADDPLAEVEQRPHMFTIPGQA